ncbi:uncharacterized protein LOC135094363 [Scylla paramamosain]|uniref:uncharacterized protein LOC135094363 n=1 Tax=Scylla paramamosain TaxID=85552 RepID=UPI00308310AB
MKLHLLPFLFLLLLLVLGQCANHQGRRHVQGGTSMEKQHLRIPRVKIPKWIRKVFRKKSKSSKSNLSEIEPIGLEENMDWQEPSSGTSDGNIPRARTPDEDPRKDWEKWNNKDDTYLGSRRGELPKYWDRWDDKETSTVDATKHWETWIDRREDKFWSNRG